MVKIIYSSSFSREYRKLPAEVKSGAEEKEQIFRQDPFDARLKTHKLHGRLSEFWSFSISHKYRIIFEFGDGDVVYFHSVGNHDIYE